MYTKQSLQSDLAAMGIVPEDTLLVHSSMKSIGPVEGGADTVLDAFMEYLGPRGLFVMPTLTYAAVNADHPRFDVRATPTTCGILPQLFWQRTGVVRSLHPTHSVAAYGHDARAFTAGHEHSDTPAPKGSPWWRLLERHAKILFIGTPGVSCNTFCHGVDEWTGHTEMVNPVPQQLEIVDYDGNVLPYSLHRHCVPRNAFYGTLEDEFRRNGTLADGHLGDARCWLLTCDGIAKTLGVKR
jgi:aminoglycoside 3-N-acetyltransferase